MAGRVPDFFIIGAPKCGTTSLAEYLRQHPAVWFSEPKEPMFYNTDTRRYPVSRDEYLRLFENAPRGALVGEGSANYLRSRVAVPAILRDNPEARFIVLLREPFAAVRSLHNHYLARRMEDVQDLATAWALQERRARGEAIPPYCLNPAALQYAEFGRYSESIERLFATVPRDRVLVHISEEFFADPRAGYLGTLRFLGLEDDGFSAFAVHNAAFDLRWRTPLAWLLRASSIGGPWYRRTKGVANALGLRPGAWFVARSRRLRRPRRRPMTLSPGFEQMVRRHFEPEIERLERLLGRDLDIWRHARPSRSS